MRASSVNMRGNSRPIFEKDEGREYMAERFPLQMALHLAPRMIRVSPPEEDREFPGPQASTRVTFAPPRNKYSAVQPPKAPAPITTT